MIYTDPTTGLTYEHIVSPLSQTGCLCISRDGRLLASISNVPRQQYPFKYNRDEITLADIGRGYAAIHDIL